ncbi:DNA helicase MCM8 [Orchesella cincta]|uniref:DNA helicase MCM8 n=1 Tax=Orchesella cincta TaxID=48709 RepID=A0A1D2NGX9_ORCCI|nr:DNA helicase MCM8 [Orchesella cincta]
MDSGGGANGGRGRGRGRYPSRWMYNKKRGGGGRGSRGRGTFGNNSEGESSGANYNNGRRGGRGVTGFSNNFSSSPPEDADRGDDQPPPSKRRKRTNGLLAIKSSVEKQWRTKLPGYDMYYNDQPPQLPESDKKIDAVESILIRQGFLSDLSVWDENEEQSYYAVGVEDVVKDERFCEIWPDFSEDLFNTPDDTITLWSAAAHKAVFNAMLNQEPSSDDSSEHGEIPNVSKITVGFTKTDQVTPLVAIKSGLLGKFVTIRGAVVRTGNIHPYCLRLAFRCKVCDDEFVIEQPEGKFTTPTVCKTEECKNTRTNLFEPLQSSPKTIMIDAKRIRVQDIQHCDIERGSVPRTMDCELFGELANCCNTGDAVTLSGVVKMSKESNYGGEQSLHHMYIETSGIKQHKDSDRTMGGHLFSFTNKDYYAIKAIHDTHDLIKLLIASLCPSIFGHELVKAGILLCLFGGTPQADGFVSKRSDINMLMIGDPGIGKSQMLKVVTEVAPRAVYVCGTGSTVAGLTVTLVRDGDDYSLEAGALVMADRGMCCIDEFDKMAAQHHALLEALEQQSVSIAKSGVFRTLPARSSVIAAANPVGGHYDRCKTVNENIKINPALLSRFDLIFILLDKSDKDFDRKIIEHMMGTRESPKGSYKSTQNQTPQNNVLDNNASGPSMRFIDRVKIQNQEKLDLIPHVLLRKYIAYAKQYVKPRITPDAADLLKQHYLNLRVTHRGIDSTPVTARQLESLARAKAELREEATVQDASDVLEIFDFSLSSVFDSEIPAVSALEQSILTNSSSSSRPRSGATQAKKLVNVLQQQAVRQSKNIFTVDEIKSVAVGLGLLNDINSIIATLNNAGFLLKKGSKTYQLQTADY